MKNGKITFMRRLVVMLSSTGLIFGNQLPVAANTLTESTIIISENATGTSVSSVQLSEEKIVIKSMEKSMSDQNPTNEHLRVETVKQEESSAIVENYTLPTQKGASNLSADNTPASNSFDIGSVPKTTNSNEDWALRLINKNNPLPDGYIPGLSSLKNGLKFDSRAITQLNAMLAAAKEQGLSPVVCSAYRSVERQKELFDNQVKMQMARGLSYEQAKTEACKTVAYPGTSEHNSGLAVDIVSLNYQILDNAQANTPENKWLLAHCAEYGFILRYPQNKSNLTGIMYEPWHFRYVGVEAAKTIMESGICLEEY